MTTIIALIVGLAAGLAIGLTFAVWQLRARTTEHRRAIDTLEQNANRRIDDYRQAADRRVADLTEAHNRELDSLNNRFKAIAGEALDANSRRLDQQARAGLEAILGPVKESINRFTSDFQRMYIDDTNQRTALREGIETLRQLNMQVSGEARRLSAALKGNTSVQGKWGEMVLANILEHSGLEPGRWLVYQEETRNDGQRLRPDAVIHCPRKRDIIIDAKVSLTSYLRSLECEPDERQTYLDEHLKSVENHVRGLQQRDYNKRIGGADAGFVLMFMPHEGAYLAAMNADPDLWQRAYDRNIIIVSPTHLVTVVRLVEQMWQTEDQTANSIAIAGEATKMLDQFNDFLTDLKNVGSYIDRADAAWTSAIKRLSTGNGNLVRRAERLRDLGIKTKKAMPELPQIDDTEAAGSSDDRLIAD